MTPAPMILRKLLPMLASDNDGEVIASVQAIRRALKSAGMDLHDLARLVTGASREPPPRPERERERPDTDLQRGYQIIQQACDAGLNLSPWERGFFSDTALRVRAGFTLTVKQQAVYERLRALAETHLDACGAAA